MKLLDVADMPGFNAAAINAGVVDRVKTGQGQKTSRHVKPDEQAMDRQRSVTRGRIYWGRPTRWSLETVCCVNHGAMNCVDAFPSGKLWRCTMCNEGAYQETGAPK